MITNTSLRTKRLIWHGLFWLNLAVIFYFWWLGSADLWRTGQASGMLIALGRITGLLSEYFILIQLVLMGRISWIERLYGHDKQNRLHQIIGLSIVPVLVLHPILITFGYGLQNHVTFWMQFMDFLQNWEDVWKAFLGLCLLVIAVFFSLNFIRSKLRYERWHLTHILMYLAIGLFFGHQINTASVSHGLALYYWLALNFIVFGIFLIFRFLRPLFLFYRHHFYVERVVRENDKVSSIYIAGRDLGDFAFQGGQFANFNFLTRGLWTSHPFSFSIGPGNSHLRISVKSDGDFTSRVAEIQRGTKVLIDGPLGRFTKIAATVPKKLFIAGGIGITPIRAMIESLEHPEEAVLLYAVRTTSDAIFREELARLTPHMYIVTSVEKTGETGRIDMEKIQRLVPDFKDREVYICGPVAMMDSLSALLREHGIPKHRIHFEKFWY